MTNHTKVYGICENKCFVEVKDKATLEAEKSAIEADISALETTTTGHGGRLDTIEDDIEAIEGDITTIEGNITAIQTKNTQQDTAISGKVNSPSTAGVSGQVLGLDSNLNTVWKSAGGDLTIQTTKPSFDTLFTINTTATISGTYCAKITAKRDFIASYAGGSLSGTIVVRKGQIFLTEGSYLFKIYGTSDIISSSDSYYLAKAYAVYLNCNINTKTIDLILGYLHIPKMSSSGVSTTLRLESYTETYGVPNVTSSAITKVWYIMM